MKKLISFILTLGIIFTLSACAESPEKALENKFKGMDGELRYDEVVQLLGEPYEKGGENVKYLSYKLQDGKTPYTLIFDDEETTVWLYW